MTAKDITWAGGEHAFDLKIEHLRALQDKCDAGPEWLMRRLLSPQWMVDDVVHTVRLGLEGGGMDKDAARKLVRTHLEDAPENLKPAALVAGMVLMNAVMVGDDSDDDGDEPGEASPAAA